jgi:hypothetical protein
VDFCLDKGLSGAAGEFDGRMAFSYSLLMLEMPIINLAGVSQYADFQLRISLVLGYGPGLAESFLSTLIVHLLQSQVKAILAQ